MADINAATNAMASSLIEADWRYHTGDDSSWANPEFDDSGWEVLTTQFVSQLRPEDSGSHIGWIRLDCSGSLLLHTLGKERDAELLELVRIS